MIILYDVQLSLWLTSIVHGNTGITAMGFFTITKESILTVSWSLVSLIAISCLVGGKYVAQWIESRNFKSD